MTLNQHEVRRMVNALRAPDVSPQTAARAADLLDELAEDLAGVIDELSEANMMLDDVSAL